MAFKRKGLRVTEPKAQQRSTYFLQLPYRWGVPLMITSGLLHWLLSQTIFLVRLDVRGLNGQIRPQQSMSACGYSSSAFVALISLSGIVYLVTLIVSLRGMEENIPMATSCSAMISAACHPPAEDQEAHLKKVQWGVVEKKYGGVGHCTFTSLEVTRAVVGKVYV